MIDANLGELTNDTLMCKNPSHCWGCKVKVACDVPVSLLNSLFQTSQKNVFWDEEKMRKTRPVYNTQLCQLIFWTAG